MSQQLKGCKKIRLLENRNGVRALHDPDVNTRGSLVEFERLHQLAFL